jgi:hypothetical protein
VLPDRPLAGIPKVAVGAGTDVAGVNPGTVVGVEVPQ